MELSTDEKIMVLSGRLEKAQIGLRQTAEEMRLGRQEKARSWKDTSNWFRGLLFARNTLNQAIDQLIEIGAPPGMLEVLSAGERPELSIGFNFDGGDMHVFEDDGRICMKVRVANNYDTFVLKDFQVCALASYLHSFIHPSPASRGTKNGTETGHRDNHNR